MIPPYYCPLCDRYDTHPHKHDPLTILAWFAAFLVVASMFALLVLYMTGAPR